MLTIHMPEDRQEDRQKRRWQALGYLIAGAIIMVSVFAAYNTQLWWLPPIVESWWLWAVWSQDWTVK